MRRLLFLSALAASALFAVPPASADVVATIDLAAQKMTVKVDGTVQHEWAISSGRGSYRTPVGTFRPQSMHARHFSSLFNNAPMPYSIFFHGHYAVHGTTDIKNLGRPASHGCVRLHPANARVLFELIQKQGPANAQIVVTG
jgi:lipoprotein-anchoring transpeptidase ErfK/SrfK